MFNDMLLRLFLKAVCAAISTDVTQFNPGESQLWSMARSSSNSKVDGETALYNTDGIISLHGYGKLEVLLLETSKYFDSIDSFQYSFDHHEGLFGSLSMLKAIADAYSIGNMQTFGKVKDFFVHAAEKTVRLWSIRYVPEGSAYEL
ncbi:uncharacterized protein RHIMIDRAFT_295516 [Rhizopus microsporus ATCC 52813]|uniref:Uncharacterized protein n=1 Tax=Rhizopus microsporus ATCC 52813 TaxID=1340429 RepID=A0A2G4SGS8_RHIZD|nr:uncharacterized protein RHIMIDRAFT_295516 [Rhizopus microsporus ATCC 52813]PHZ07963.1 hypothetical protein RHIMIDRAFT_295516 [Rhizopus microsporus ATCC 52813]